MSDAGRPYTVRVEPERIPSRPIALIVVISILVVVASAAIVRLWLPRRQVVETSLSGAPRHVGEIEVTVFRALESKDQADRADRDALERFGWVDRDKGLVSIPIDDAIGIVVRGQR